MRKREMGDEDQNNVEDISGYEKSGVRLAWLGWDDVLPVWIYAGSGLVPAVSGMGNSLAPKILSSPSLSWWSPPYPVIPLFPVVNSTISWKHNVKSSLSISPCHDQELTLSTAYTKYSIHWVLHTQRTASSQVRLSPAARQSLLLR